MAGHSHWAKIKRAKGANDARRGRMFSKIARKIINAARQGGPDPGMNIPLRYAIDEAHAVNMPNEAIDRNIKRATGEAGGVSFEEITYEAFTPGGAAMLIETLTDNRNRTVGEVRSLLEKRGAKLAPNGAVSFMFPKRGVIVVPKSITSETGRRHQTVTVAQAEDAVMEAALEAGAEDFITGDDAYEVRTSVAGFEAVKKALADRKFKWDSAEIAAVPTATVPLDVETGRKALAIVDALEEHDDVQKVWFNFEVPDEAMAEV
jgi:YebC/PmpR family DNA-binding regulatory protein